MTPLRSRSARVEESAGFDYLATDAHYRSLARRIVTALGGERGVVLVTSEPPASPLLISEAISGETSARFSVIGVSGGPELTCDGLVRAVPALAARSAALFVLDDADRLSDAQIEEVYEAVLHGDRTVAAAVLLARPSFLTRLERPGLHFLQDGSVAHLDFQQLGPDEIGPFLRHEFRLPADAALLSPESLSAIGSATKGDPAMASRLARRLLQDGGAKSAAALTLTPAESRAAHADVAAEKAISGADASPKPIEETSADGTEPAADAATADADEPRPSNAAILGSLGEISQAITDAAGESTGTPREADAADKELTASLLNQPVGGSAPTPKPSAPPAVASPQTPQQARARRIRLAVLICAAYLVVVGVASVTVFALLRPTASSDVAETKGVVGSWLTKKETLETKHDGQVASVKPTTTPVPVPSATPARAADDMPPSPPAVIAEALPSPPAAAARTPEKKVTAAAHTDHAPAVKPAPTAAAEASAEPPAPVSSPADAAPPPLPPALPGEPSTTPADASASTPPSPKEKPPVPAVETKTVDAAPAKPAAPSAKPARAAPAAVAPAVPAAKPRSAAPAPVPAATAAPSAKPTLSAAEIAELKARGDALLNTGDIVSARLFYERAGEAGDAQAALMAGETFDPAVLLRAGVRGVRGDAAQAAEWYRRASALGSDEAARRLKSLGK